jgi:hypothetical protein
MLIQYLCIFFPRHSHHSIHSQESTLLGPLSNIISIRNGRTAVVAGRYVDAISESITLIDIQGTFVHVHIAVLAGPCTVAQTIATREQALAVDAFRTQACKGEVMSNLYNLQSMGYRTYISPGGRLELRFACTWWMPLLEKSCHL